MSNDLTILPQRTQQLFRFADRLLVMAFFGLIAGYFFYIYVAIFVSAAWNRR